MRLTLLAFVISIAACGGGSESPDAMPMPPDATPPPDAMTPGTQTLLVQGTFIVEDTDNLTSGNYRVNCDLRVTKVGGEPVTDAIIEINPAPPANVSYLAGQPTDPSHYLGNYNPFRDTARLSVFTASGDDGFVSEVTLSGPQLYTVEQPARDQTVPSSSPLHISWSQPQGAEDSADVQLMSGYSMTAIPDTGVHDIPATSLVVGPDELTVTRYKHNVLVGGAPGSYIDFGIRNHVPFTTN